MSKRIWITGADGFVGSHLLKRLQGFELYTPSFDLRDPASISQAASVKVHTVVHLAGLSHVPTCEEDPESALQINRNGSETLYAEVLKTSPQAHFIFASTAQVYAKPNEQEAKEGVVFDESRAIAPQNAYALSKKEAEDKLQALAADHAMSCLTVLRFFNHTHRTQAAAFFLPHLYTELMKAKKSGSSRVQVPVGNLELWRDMGSIQDLVGAISAMVSETGHERLRVFNVCSGTAKHLRRLADLLAQALEITPELVTDLKRMRPGEATTLTGSHAKLTQATGWRPTCLTEENLIRSFLT